MSLQFAGCKSELLDKLEYTISPTQDSVQIELQFTKLFPSYFEGLYELKDYGNIFLSPYKKRNPFKIGFSLKPELFNDPDLLKLKTTTTLPTGKTLPPTINRALVKSNLNSNNIDYSIYLYADTFGKEWAGVVILFNEYDSKHMPRDYFITQDYFKAADGSSRATVVVFGPTNINKLSVEMPAGIAIFANLPAMLKLEEKSGTDTGSPHSLIQNNVK